jgi:hypothetical protein
MGLGSVLELAEEKGSTERKQYLCLHSKFSTENCDAKKGLEGSSCGFIIRH